MLSNTMRSLSVGCLCGGGSRFEKRIYIALPEMDARRDMFRIHIGDTAGVRMTEAELDRLAALTEGCVPLRGGTAMCHVVCLCGVCCVVCRVLSACSVYRRGVRSCH